MSYNTLATKLICLTLLILLSGCELNSSSPGFSISPTSGLITTENGGTADFDIVLNARPDALVTVAMRSSNSNEGLLSKDEVSFSPANWSTPQTVSIAGVDDDQPDGDTVYHIDFPAIKSGDKRYSKKSINSLAVVNLDNEVSQNPPNKPTAGINLSPSGVLITSENKTSANISLVLLSEPASDVNITAASSNTNEGMVSPSVYTFNSGNWNTAAVFTVTGVDDAVADGNVRYTVTFSAQSNDPLYNGINIPAVQMDNVDNDIPGITINANTPLQTSEDLTTASFTVLLNTKPTADVSIAISSSDTTEGVVSPGSVTFTAANWNTAQTVVVSGVDDTEVDGSVNYDISFTTHSADLLYDGVAITPLLAVNADNDSNGPKQYNLYIEPGTLDIAASTISGNGAATLPVLGFAFTAGSPGATPGPVIEALTGQTVVINVTNHHTSTHRFSIEGLLSNPGELLPGETKQFQLTPIQAGIYRYGDPQLPDRSLGLHGAFVVRPANNPNTAWTSGPAFTQERTWVIADFDETWLRNTGTINTAAYNPNYFLINGKSGFAASQDTESYVDGNIGDTVLIRVVNAGQYDQSLHFHSHHVQILSHDGIKTTNVADAPFAATVNIKRGSTAMLLLSLSKAGTYPVNTQTAQMQTSNGVYLNGAMTNIIAR